MTDSLGKVVGIFIAVLLLFIYPICHMADQQEETSKILALNATTKLVDSVRDKGYIDGDMYDRFLSELAVTGPAFDVTIEHKHQKYYPVYSDINDPDSFTGEVDVIYEGYFTSEIESALTTADIYYLSKDDYFEIEIKNTTETFAGQIRSLLFGRDDMSCIYVKYGGRVRYEN